MVIERVGRHVSAPIKDSQAVTLTEACEKTFTSPTALAKLRCNLSRFILNLSPDDPSACQLATLATKKHVFCPDELVVLRELQTPLPEPWEPDETLEDDTPFPDPDQWWHPGSRATKFIPSDYQLDRTIDEAIESGKRVGVYFMVADMFNAGHLDALTQARESGECDLLLLLLTTDLLTAEMKSTPEDLRPQLSSYQRVYMASQIQAVDAVYTMPTILTPAHMVFEMAALAINHERLRVELDNRGDERIRPLDLEIIRHLYGDERWGFYVQAYLGFSPYRNPALDACLDFYQPGVYPAALQIAYKRLWSNWANGYGLEHFTLFTSDFDPRIAQFHIKQASCFLFWGEELKIVQVSSRCPNTSSSYLFHNHPLRSEAEEENLKILRMLQDWEKEKDGRLFSNWKNPLFHPVPKYAWLTD